MVQFWSSSNSVEFMHYYELSYCNALYVCCLKADRWVEFTLLCPWEQVLWAGQRAEAWRGKVTHTLHWLHTGQKQNKHKWSLEWVTYYTQAIFVMHHDIWPNLLFCITIFAGYIFIPKRINCFRNRTGRFFKLIIAYKVTVINQRVLKNKLRFIKWQRNVRSLNNSVCLLCLLIINMHLINGTYIFYIYI